MGNVTDETAALPREVGVGSLAVGDVVNDGKDTHTVLEIVRKSPKQITIRFSGVSEPIKLMRRARIKLISTSPVRE